jgi:hypothetical protein
MSTRKRKRFEGNGMMAHHALKVMASSGEIVVESYRILGRLPTLSSFVLIEDNATGKQYTVHESRLSKAKL